jgi:hypothetical protein
MFDFLKAKEVPPLQHWIAFVDGFQYAPSEFYDAVEKELKARQVPGMEMSRIEFAQGGILSDKRLYLRMVRERLTFDVCAAPFGTSFFFSCRMADIPVAVQLWQLFLLVMALGICGILSFTILAKVFGGMVIILFPFLWMVLFILGFYVLRNAVAMGLKDLDATLIKSPIVGPIYESWFRKVTYYRIDTRLMYLEIVGSVVKKLADDAIAIKGVKLTKQYEQSPILSELYKPVAPKNP